LFLNIVFGYIVLFTYTIKSKQTELSFTLAKNTTKPNPFKIISLQTTRKENNWKTEEKLARAVITLETERIKESNP
jgi:predicted Holliday junction resolvase-like endonuclease